MPEIWIHLVQCCIIHWVVPLGFLLIFVALDIGMAVTPPGILWSTFEGFPAASQLIAVVLRPVVCIKKYIRTGVLIVQNYQDNMLQHTCRWTLKM